MKEIKQLNLRFLLKDFEAVREGKKEGESWETYILRKTVKEGKN